MSEMCLVCFRPVELAAKRSMFSLERWWTTSTGSVVESSDNTVPSG